MIVTGFDTETYPFGPGMTAPRMVCASSSRGELFTRAEAVERFRGSLERGETLVAHHAPYDLGVFCAEDPSLLPLVFQALEEGRIKCTLIREKLLNNATGNLTFSPEGKKVSYALAALVLRYFGEELPKEGTYRERFAELDGLPLKEWPQEARTYAIRDAAEAKRVFDAQEKRALEIFEGGVIPDEDRQHRAAFWLALASAWGLRTDARSIRALKHKLERRVRKLSPFFVGSPFVRANGTRDMRAIRAAVEEALPNVERTPTGLADVSAETLEATRIVPLRALAAVSRAEKLLSTYVPVLESGTVHPITPSYVSLVESGRTACREPNIQNLPAFPGVRECFVPRAGYLFASVDYDTLELRALAQTCLTLFGFSRMAEELRAGRDLHLAVAASILSMGVEEVTALYHAGDARAKQARKLAKVASFGFAGGLGARRFVEYCAGWGIELSEPEAKRLKKLWLSTFPEMVRYFDFISRATDSGRAVVGPPLLPLVRGGLSFTELANTLFQGPAAAGAKDAGWLLAKACYVEPSSPLYGSRIVAFVHDEFLMEHPRADAALRVKEQERLMILGMKGVIGDIPITASGKLMERWEK